MGERFLNWVQDQIQNQGTQVEFVISERDIDWVSPAELKIHFNFDRICIQDEEMDLCFSNGSVNGKVKLSLSSWVKITEFGPVNVKRVRYEKNSLPESFKQSDQSWQIPSWVSLDLKIRSVEIPHFQFIEHSLNRNVSLISEHHQDSQVLWQQFNQVLVPEENERQDSFLQGVPMNSRSSDGSGSYIISSSGISSSVVWYL